jgi:hypothetical protein
MEYIGEHLLPGKIGHFFALLSFAASFVALIAYFKATTAKTTEEETGWRRMARMAFRIDVFSVFAVFHDHLYHCQSSFRIQFRLGAFQQDDAAAISAGLYLGSPGRQLPAMDVVGLCAGDDPDPESR